MNYVVLVGNLTSDPKLSYTETTQTAVGSFRLAVTRATKDGGTDFIQCKVFGRQAETLHQYKSKGDEIAVHGRIETGSYKNRDGVTVYTTDVVCDRIEYTRGSKGEHSAQIEDPRSKAKNEESTFEPSKGFEAQTKIDWDDLPDSFEQAEDDIPF